MMTADLLEERLGPGSRITGGYQNSYLEKQIYENLGLMKLELDRDREIKKEFFGIKFSKSVNFQEIKNSVTQAVQQVATSKLDNVEFKRHPELKNQQAQQIQALLHNLTRITNEKQEKLEKVYQFGQETELMIKANKKTDQVLESTNVSVQDQAEAARRERERE